MSLSGKSPSMNAPPKGNFYLYSFIVWLTVAYSAINPFVYLTFNQKFRNRFKHLYEDCLSKPRGMVLLFLQSQSVKLEQI